MLGCDKIFPLFVPPWRRIGTDIIDEMSRPARATGTLAAAPAPPAPRNRCKVYLRTLPSRL
jgi:hypothetical protein